MGIAKPICLVAALLAASWPAAAPAAGQPSARTVRLGSAADVMTIAEQALGHGDSHAAELAFRALLDDPRPAVRAEARFRLAKMLAAAGRTSEAAVLLRRVVDEHPAAAPARLELAALLSKMGHQDSALRELRAVRTAALPPSIARFVDRWSAALQSGKPFGLQLELALAPDSNINRATRSDTLGTVFGDFTFSDDAKAKSGIGAALRGTAHARIALSRDVGIVGRAAADANLYRDKDFNDISLGLAFGPEVKLGSTRLALDLGVGQQWYGMQPYQRSYRLAAGVIVPVDSVSQLDAGAAVRWNDNRFNDLLDGRGVTLRARYERALSQQLSLAATLTADRFQARDDAYSTRSWAAGLTAYRNIGRISLSAGVEYGRLEADERLAILPEAREDRFTRFHFGAVLRHLTVAGFAPMSRIVVERNHSSVEFYDFQRTRTEVGITRAF